MPEVDAIDRAGGATRVRSVAIPSEHGGWSLTLEPVVLGLLVAASPAGFAVGGAALVGFLIRTPIRVVLVDRFRHRWLPRTTVASWTAAVEGLLMIGLIVLAVATARAPFWWPAAAAAPLVGVATWFDARSRSRRLVPELAGAVGVGAAAAMVVLAAGSGWSTAVGAWVVIGARGVASVPFVRVQLRRAKQQMFRRWHSDVAQGIGLGVVTAGFVSGVIPAAAIAPVGALALFQVVMVRRPVPPTPVLGAQQIAGGLVIVLGAGLALGAA